MDKRATEIPNRLWILDFGFWIVDFYCQPLEARNEFILDIGYRIARQQRLGLDGVLELI